MAPLSVYAVLDTLKVAINTTQFMGFASELILSKVPVHSSPLKDIGSDRSLNSIRVHLERWSARLETCLAEIPQTTRYADTNISNITTLSQQCKRDCDELGSIVRKLMTDFTLNCTWDSFNAAIESIQGEQFVIDFIGRHQGRQRKVGSCALILIDRFCSEHDTEFNDVRIRHNPSNSVQQINANLDSLRERLFNQHGMKLDNEPVLLEIKNILEALARNDATDITQMVDDNVDSILDSVPPSTNDNQNHERQKGQDHHSGRHKRPRASFRRTLVDLIVALILFILTYLTKPVKILKARRTSTRSNTSSQNIPVLENPAGSRDEQDLSELTYAYNIHHDPIEFSCLPELVDSVVRLFPKRCRSRESPVPPDKGRVRWICGRCGLCLYDDFSGLTPESLKDIENELRSKNSPQPPIRPNGGLSNWIPTFRDFKQGIRIILRGWRSNGNASLPLHTTQQFPTNGLSTNSKILYILYCVHDSRTGIRFHQERLHNISTDKELLSFLKAQYRQHRNTLSWFRLRHVSKVLVNRFEVDLSHFAQIHRHDSFCSSANCVCLPPTDKIDAEYTCGPAPQKPPKQFPVFGENYLIHYFKNPQCLSEKQKTIFRQLPKRTCGRLCVSDDEEQPTFGWGIYFEEGWHWESIYFVIVVLLLTGSLVFGITWSMSKGDIQGAFAVSSYWVTLGSLFLGYVAVRSS
ncbi:hypothetical protein F4776DRAFT_592738 [Hypoxylon sp. NC0597]|nr:hypothetical protein F4776DRAFT_592738 [Hypoxylon sp. NC0597]